MPFGEATLRRFAERALGGVGDAALGEWSNWTGKAFHLRRRLSAEEHAQVGDVVDVRGTEEGERRIAAARRANPRAVPADWRE